MIQEIFIVETLQFKHFSYSLTPPRAEGGYYASLEEARQSVERLNPRVGLWVCISSLPLGVLNPEQQKQALELYEYIENEKGRGFRPCLEPRTPVERLIFKTLNIPHRKAQPYSLIIARQQNYQYLKKSS